MMPARLDPIAMTAPAPLEIRAHQADRTLEVTFDDGLHATLPAEYLRVESPSAEVQGHGPGQRRLVVGKAMVGIAAVEPVGHYAVRIRFSDGHDTGIYSWALLHQLAREQSVRWAAYVDELARSGLNREP